MRKESKKLEKVFYFLFYIFCLLIKVALQVDFEDEINENPGIEMMRLWTKLYLLVGGFLTSSSFFIFLGFVVRFLFSS